MAFIDLDPVLRFLENTSFAVAIRENDLLFPWIESLHVLAIVVVVGTITVIDLRLIGVASMDRTARRLLGDVLPCTWIAFGAAAATGLSLFSSKAFEYAHNFYFQGKITLLVLASLNMAFFHLIGSRRLDEWDALQTTPFLAKLAGGISLAIWATVIVFGRWIGFTMR